MSDGMVYAKSTDTKRVLLLGGMTSAWYDLAADDERARVLDRFHKLMDEWRELGARVVGTLDDDLHMVGQPLSPRPTFYLLFDVDDADVPTAMIQRLREPVGGIRMDRYARFEAHIGRPFFLLEPQ